MTIRDGYPVSPGHTLLIPNRHVVDWFDLNAEEVVDLLTATRDAKIVLDSELHPDGYNLGVNAGVAAGQTVMHVHLHLIPRFVGDTPDPRGGIRHCVPIAVTTIRRLHRSEPPDRATADRDSAEAATASFRGSVCRELQVCSLDDSDGFDGLSKEIGPWNTDHSAEPECRSARFASER
jgi:diadenosine tetraphosphate (Ap4A) HIT family hydrolase